MANPHPPALPPPGRCSPWCASLLVSVALLVAAAWLAGSDARPDAPEGLLEPVLRTATSSPAIAAIFVLGLVMLLYSLRRLVLLSLAHRPGAIRVADLGDATSAKNAPVRKLTLHLRGRLTTINLHSPSPQPGSAASVSFLDELQDAADKPHNLLYTIAGLLRTVLPSHAYTVEGLLVHRDASPTCGVAIQVATQMGGLSPPATLWAENWETAVEEGAIYAAALILPHTRKCREAPWSSWERRPMPAELLGAYLRARSHHSDRRYDEALGAYYEALAIDPLNLELRLEVGQLQEQLALWLDALASYQQIVTLTPRRRRRVTPRVLSPRGRALHNAHRRASIIARYRSTVLLGGAEKLAQQWLEPARAPGDVKRTERQRERDQLRDQIRPGLQRRYGPAIEQARATDAANAPPDWSAVIAPRPAGVQEASPRTRELWLREYFQVAAADEARRLLRGSLRPAARLSDTGITRHYLRVVVLWVHLHRNRTRAAARRSPIHTEPVREWTRSRRLVPGLRAAIRPRPGPIERWPATEAYVRHELHRWPRRLERRLSVADRYNAGCVYAVPLLGHPGNTRFDAACVIDEAQRLPEAEPALADEARELAEAVVGEFAEAAFTDHSAEFALRRAWLISEDPDLAGLRARPEFASFERIHLPSARATVTRPVDAHILELSRHTSRIVRRCARALEAEWHARDRASRDGCDVHDAGTWIRQERRAWHLAWRLSHDHRHWPTRLAVVREMERWTLTEGRAPVSLPYPEYADDPLSDPSDGLSFEQSARPVIDLHDARLADLRRLLDERRVDVRLERWRWALERLDGENRPLPGRELAGLCRGQAALWRALHNWFEDQPGSGRPTVDVAAFEVAIEQLGEPPAAG
jgi:tetratricopeptide (TPR) repeat protein